MPGRAEPPQIRVLPEVLANQIAAGEVVERPAAVVKELCENAIDAGATRVVVRIADGGRRLVEVEDDGHGMRPDDLRTAIQRHATSKLHDAEGLFRIATLGFRGEALPSIASVSEMEITSRLHGAEAGFQVRWEAGREVAAGPAGASPGTRVSVRNLFWNVPARLKFLKTESSETGHVTDQVIRLALSHPGVAFALESDARTVLELPAGGVLPERIRSLFGKELAAALIPVTATRDACELSGFVAHPREARPTSKRQFTFLNGRYIRDKLILAAVREGYKGFLEPRLHGSVFLHLDLDPELVDVNVHPQKAEVRFRREGEVFALVSRAVQAALQEHQGGFSLLTPEDRAKVQAAPGPAQVSAIVQRTVVKSAGPPPIQERFLPIEPVVERRAAEPVAQYAAKPIGLAGAVLQTAMAVPAGPSAIGSPVQADAATPVPPPSVPGMPRTVRRILQLNRMFLLIETDSGIRLVDQHALHEKALFLALDPARTDVLAGGRQELLVPRTVELHAAEVAAIAPLLPQLRPFGIEAEVFGPATVLVRAHPASLRRTNWTGFFAALGEGGSAAGAVERLRERIAHSLACHGAVKAGQELSADEQRELVRMLYELEGLEHCPHGRPTTLDLPWDELGRRFQRS